jgi:protein O-GlcNAc transferase
VLTANRLNIELTRALWHNTPSSAVESRSIRAGFFRVTGVAAFHRVDYVQAKQLFAQALEQEDDLLLRYYLGLSYYQLGQQQEALEQWRRAMPESIARALAHKAALANRAHDAASAAAHAETALQLDPQLGEAYLERGRARAALEDWPGALADYKTAAGLIQDHYTLNSLYRSMGALYAQAGDLEAALLSYQNAVELAPDAYLAHVQLAGAYSALSRFEDTAAQLEQAISLEPGNVLAYLHMGELFRRNGQPELARHWYERAQQVDRTSGRADYAMGALLLAEGRVDEAIIYIERATELGWQPHWVWFDLGDAYKQSGRLDKAAECYLRVTAMAGVSKAVLSAAWLNLARVHADAGDLAQAETAWLQALQSDASLVRPAFLEREP